MHVRVSVRGGNGWQLFADEGEMKMYRREEEVNGMVIDPLKACHVVQGVTAREMCHYFFSPEYRMDWETTLENMTILETISPDTLVFLQTHKRIWPASQRDALFWSHMRRVADDLEDPDTHDAWIVCNHSTEHETYPTISPDTLVFLQTHKRIWPASQRDALFWSHMRRVADDLEDPDTHDAWIVCNHSTEHETYPPANTGKCVRIYLTVILYCQTYISEAARVNGKISRKDLSCKITYCSVVNPGGWAPATVLRAVYKKEYPKFLKRYTQYVVDQCKNKPIMF
uniref:START domain-containing protein n=1 Tax=Lutzomyia longipalpis TaxID=7200 RepID=A0A1B0C8B5_LUTLO